MTSIDLTEFIDFATVLAGRAGDIVRPYFGSRDLAVEAKSDASPVTQADREAEEAMRELIATRYPHHGIIGEEYGREHEDAEWVWVLDPIDGTISFTSACPLFGTLVGLLHQGQPVLGVISQPVLRQLMIGTAEGTRLNGRPVRVRATERLEDAVLLTTDIASIAAYQDGAAFDRLRSRVRLFRTWGDCYGYLLVASGNADAMVDPRMSEWDLLPLVPIMEGAGGVISSWTGGSAVGADSCVAAGAGVHGVVVEVLSA
jgi:myo-inositol-1(or 4)-monophosphatase